MAEDEIGKRYVVWELDFGSLVVERTEDFGKVWVDAVVVSVSRFDVFAVVYGIGSVLVLAILVLLCDFFSYYSCD